MILPKVRGGGGGGGGGGYRGGKTGLTFGATLILIAFLGKVFA